MNSGLKVEGLAEIQRTLRSLPDALSHKIQQKAHENAAKPLIQRARQLAPIREGTLSESIGAVKPTLKKANEIGEIRIGPRRRRPYRGFAGHLIEFGTKARKNKRGQNRGFVKKHPFMEPAFKQTYTQVLSTIKVETGKVLVSKMKRTLGKAFIR